MRIFLFCSAFACCSWAFSQSSTQVEDIFRYPVYVGLEGGYGSTTWEGLVPAAEKQNVAINISTPTWVNEGGGVWGVLAGFEVSPYFAIEANYMHYPDARVFFDEDSLYAFENDGRLELRTHTDTASLMAKVMMIIPKTSFRAYSSAGIARVQRNDDINRDWRASPTFAIGINYVFTPHIMTELGVNYTAGYGESELSPAKDYIPFLYSTFLKLAYRF